MIKKLIPVFLAICLLFAGCAPQTTVAVAGITYDVLYNSGSVAANEESATFTLNQTYSSFDCTIDEMDELYCHSDTTMGFHVSGPAPEPVELPQLTDEELAAIEADYEAIPEEERQYSWTSFESCGRYHGAVSVLDTIGSGTVVCTGESSFSFTLPQAVDTFTCSRDTYGYGCGTGEGMSFWFYLTP